MASSALEAVRLRIIAEATGPGTEAFLFEPATDRSSYYTISVGSSGQPRGSPSAQFAAGGLLVRWLRANDTYLPVPDSIGIWDELSNSEREGLDSCGVLGCLPLVAFDSLVGWVSPMLSPRMAGRPADHPRYRASQAKAWALDLYGARATAERMFQVAAVSRSNRLSLAGQLAHGIAHEVRNPLASIRSTVQLIRDEDIPSDQRTMLDRVLEDVDRINRVVSDMMALGKPRLSQPESCDVASIARNATTFCVPYALRLGQHLEQRIPHSFWAAVDPIELRQVVINLVLNACQASRSGDRVIVQVSADESPLPALLIRVVDSGLGMSQEVLKRASEPFFTTKADGVGLGLAVCRDILQRHHGDLTFESVQGSGTVATVRLPR